MSREVCLCCWLNHLWTTMPTTTTTTTSKKEKKCSTNKNRCFCLGKISRPFIHRCYFATTFIHTIILVALFIWVLPEHTLWVLITHIMSANAFGACSLSFFLPPSLSPVQVTRSKMQKFDVWCYSLPTQFVCRHHCFAQTIESVWHTLSERCFTL